MATMQKKILGDLLINDIKTELEKRHLDKNGMKSVLFERLKKALVDEGKDPNAFYFDVTEAPNNNDEDELLRNDGDLNVNGKTGGGSSTAKTAQGKGHPVSQAGDIVGGAGGHGQDVGKGNDFDEGNPGNDNEDLHSSERSQSLPRTPSTAKPGTGFLKPTTPAKGKNNQSATVREGGDDSFVLQEDDAVLNDIDADLLEGKAPDSTSALLGEAGDNKGDANKIGQGTSAATNTSAKLGENTGTEDGSKTTGSKDDKDAKTAAKSSMNTVKDEKTSQSSRTLWVSGLSSSTRATDLKTLLGKHGKVIAAKVVTNARSPASRCFGLVTMSSADDATKCVQQLHRTELHGRMISVERAKTETQGTKAKVLPPSSLKSPTKPSGRPASRKFETKPVVKKEGDVEQPSTPSKEKSGPLEKDNKDVMPFSKIKADQEQERLRRKEMYLEREKYKQHMIEKRHREEAFRIERERRRLREMREDLERQHIETERMRLETERLHMEREHEKYRREQQRVLQARRALKRRVPRDEEWSNKRPMAERFHGGERYEERPARGEEHRTFREERPNREGRPVRDERHPRDAARGPPRHEPRSEWKSEREVNRGAGGSSAWNGPVEHSKMDDEWDTGNMGQGDGWENEDLSQQNSGFGLQQGQMTTGMGTGTMFIAPQTMQGGSAMMQGNMSRQNYGLAAASARRF